MTTEPTEQAGEELDPKEIMQRGAKMFRLLEECRTPQERARVLTVALAPYGYSGREPSTTHEITWTEEDGAAPKSIPEFEREP